LIRYTDWMGVRRVYVLDSSQDSSQLKTKESILAYRERDDRRTERDFEGFVSNQAGMV